MYIFARGCSIGCSWLFLAMDFFFLRDYSVNYQTFSIKVQILHFWRQISEPLLIIPYRWILYSPWASQVAQVVKNPPSNAGGIRDLGSIPWRRAGQPTSVFLPGDSHGRGAWWATVHRVEKSWTRLKRLRQACILSSLNHPFSFLLPFFRQVILVTWLSRALGWHALFCASV